LEHNAAAAADEKEEEVMFSGSFKWHYTTSQKQGCGGSRVKTCSAWCEVPAAAAAAAAVHEAEYLLQHFYLEISPRHQNCFAACGQMHVAASNCPSPLILLLHGAVLPVVTAPVGRGADGVDAMA
jgi:hypothetical protein